MFDHRTTPALLPAVEPRAPIACAATWTAVLEAADWQCQCTGACGSRHSSTGLRCDRDHTRAQLLAAPEDLTLSPVAAAQVPRADLRAWCPDCHRKALARQRARVRELERLGADSPADTLF